jgi:hypothetical protein
MFSTGFGAFGTPGSLTTTIIGNAVIDDISTDTAAEALALAQSNFANKAEKTALALKADQSALTTLESTVNGKAEQALVGQIENAIGFATMPATMKNGTVDSMYRTVSNMSLNINTYIVQPVRVATGITQAQENGTEDSLATKLATKADQQATTAALATKADQQATANALAAKADQSALDDANTGINTNSDSISALQTASFGTSYWLTSPDYDLSGHPDSNLAMRWLHGQTSDPIAVLMYVRVFDVTLPAAQYIYPYTDSRVQPRHVVSGGGSRARYVRINCPDPDFSLSRVNITTRRLIDGTY